MELPYLGSWRFGTCMAGHVVNVLVIGGTDDQLMEVVEDGNEFVLGIGAEAASALGSEVGRWLVSRWSQWRVGVQAAGGAWQEGGCVFRGLGGIWQL